MTDPKISCVMTVFNEKDFLKFSVGSLLEQTNDNFELIIVDDGSDEATASLLDEFDDPRILVIHQANDGLSGARNKGLERITGDYVCFLDADDCRPSWAFEAAARIMKDGNPDMIMCPGILSEVSGELKQFYDWKLFDEARDRFKGKLVKITDPNWSEALHLAQLMEPQSANKFIKTQHLRSIKAAFPNTHFFEDMLFHSVCISQAQSIAFAQSPSFTYFRRYTNSQITSMSTDLRLDAVAVAKVTLELLSRLPHYHDPNYRAALLLSTFRLLKWCEENISHHYRFGFQQMLMATMQLCDALYAKVPEHLPAYFHAEPAVWNYARGYIERIPRH